MNCKKIEMHSVVLSLSLYLSLSIHLSISRQSVTGSKSKRCPRSTKVVERREREEREEKANPTLPYFYHEYHLGDHTAERLRQQ